MSLNFNLFYGFIMLAEQLERRIEFLFSLSDLESEILFNICFSILFTDNELICCNSKHIYVKHRLSKMTEVTF